eukprot:3830071-Prymnesium_polylepis.1
MSSSVAATRSFFFFCCVSTPYSKPGGISSCNRDCLLESACCTAPLILETISSRLRGSVSAICSCAAREWCGRGTCMRSTSGWAAGHASSSATTRGGMSCASPHLGRS